MLLLIKIVLVGESILRGTSLDPYIVEEVDWQSFIIWLERQVYGTRNINARWVACWFGFYHKDQNDSDIFRDKIVIRKRGV